MGLVYNPIHNRKDNMNIFNLLLYFGIFFIVMGFALFLYSEMKIREIDRKMAENQRFIDAILRTQEKK